MNASIDTLNRSAVSQVPLELLDSIEVGIAVLDRNFTVQVWNKFLENHSAKKVDFIIGHSLNRRKSILEYSWILLIWQQGL